MLAGAPQETPSRGGRSGKVGVIGGEGGGGVRPAPPVTM